MGIIGREAEMQATDESDLLVLGGKDTSATGLPLQR